MGGGAATTMRRMGLVAPILGRAYRDNELEPLEGP